MQELPGLSVKPERPVSLVSLDAVCVPVGNGPARVWAGGWSMPATRWCGSNQYAAGAPLAGWKAATGRVLVKDR